MGSTPPRGLEKGRDRECWFGDRSNHRLASLYNVQFATINTQVPGLVNRNLGGVWQSRLLEDPRRVPVGTAKAAWVPAGELSTCPTAANSGQEENPAAGRPLEEPRALVPALIGSLATSGLSRAFPTARSYLKVQAPRAARGFPARWTSPGFLWHPAPLIYMRRPASCTVVYMPRPAACLFSLAVSLALPCRRLICMLLPMRPQPSGIWLVSPKTSGIESLPLPNSRPARLVISAVGSFLQYLPSACVREIRKQNI